MKATTQLLFLCFLSLLPACKIIQNVPEGGNIISLTGQGDCPEGQTCTIDIPDGTEFSDTYTAVPNYGYSFDSWDTGLCRRRTIPCILQNIPGSLTELDYDATLTPIFSKWIGPGLAPSLDELTENTAALWGVASTEGNISVVDAEDRFHDGLQSIHIATDSGVDSWAWVPEQRDAAWDLSGFSFVRFWAYVENPNLGFQANSPWVRLGTTEGDYIELHATSDALNDARDEWHEFRIPIAGDGSWQMTQVGSPDLTNINFIEIHADTWGLGFDLWLDGLGFLAITDVAFKRDVLELFETWRYTPRLIAGTEAGAADLAISELTNWTSSQPSVASVNNTGEITAISAGSTEISADFNGNSVSLPVEVVAPVLPPQHEAISPELALPADGNLWEIPVLIIRYLPTVDGVNFDSSVMPLNWGRDITLEELRVRTDLYDRRIKFMLEEGSKFRGYNSAESLPSLGYRVVDYITIHEPTAPGKIHKMYAEGPAYQLDYTGIFERFDVQHLVDDLGVREIWIWHEVFDPTHGDYDPSIHDSRDFRWIPESNMSSPTTGDISNSYRDPTDLPIYNHTYVVYGQSIGRTQAEAIHNRGHQLESILSYVNYETEGNTDLFWQDFVGRDGNSAWQQGRAGDTHHPANAESDYDYLNNNFVETDIEDWRPDGTGATLLVNSDYWGGLIYAWPGGADSVPQRTESQWYIYWMQNMPGRGNQIPRGSEVMTNWWSFTGAWDQSIEDGLGLSTSP